MARESNDRTVAAMYQGGHIARMAEAVRQALVDVALGKDGALGRLVRERKALLIQLEIVERIATGMDEVPMPQFKPSIRPVDRMPKPYAPMEFEKPTSIDDLESLLSRPGQGTVFR